MKITFAAVLATTLVTQNCLAVKLTLAQEVTDLAEASAENNTMAVDDCELMNDDDHDLAQACT